MLKYYYDTQNDVLIFASSGTGAMEGSVSNLLSPGERMLVGTAGKFGERWLGLAQAYGIEAVKVESPYGQPVNIDAMKQKLASDGPFRAVYIQATETSTAVMNDVRALGEAVKNYPETALVVDAITGLGTSDLRIEEWGLDIVIGGSQKAVMIPPGLAFASVSEKAWGLIAKSKLPRFYFDFAKERKNQAKGETAYTPATTLIIGLHAALEYIKKLGRENLIANAALLAEASRAAAQALGLKLFAESSPANAATASLRARGHGFRRHRQGIAHPLRRDYRQRPGQHEGPDLPPGASGLLRYRGSVRSFRRAGNRAAEAGPESGARFRRARRAGSLPAPRGVGPFWILDFGLEGSADRL